MREVLVSLESWDYNKAIELGLEGEVDAVSVIFDISSWVRWYGNGIVTLLHTEKGKNFPYPCTIETSRNRVKWLIQPADLAINPFGECQLIYSVGEKTVVKSRKFTTRVFRSFGEELTDPPDPKMFWIDQVHSDYLEAKKASEQTGKDAKNAAESASLAIDKADNAAANASSASVSAAAAKISQTNAASSAESAATSAQSAANSTRSAASAAQIATEKAAEIVTSATTAAQKASEAAESAKRAETAAGVLENVIDDAKSSQTTTWSSENIISQLCPPFEVSGSIVTCQPVVGSRLNVLTQIEPIQEGTGDPSPENIRPIHGWDAVNIIQRSGKNLFSNNFTDYTKPFDYYVKKIKVPNGTYTVSIIPKGEVITGFTVAIADSGDRYADFQNFYVILTAAGETKSIIRTVKNNQLVLCIYLNSAGQAEFDELFNTYEIQLEYGSSPTAYQPYCGETFTIPLGNTMYDGTLDVAAGLLTVTHKGVNFIGDETWILYPGDIAKYGICFYTTDLSDSAYGAQLSRCSHFTNINDAWNTSNKDRIGIYSDNKTAVAKYFRPPNANVSTVDQFKAWLSSQNAAGTPVTLVYKLAEPITIHLTPTEIYALSGVNTIYADTGNVTVSGYSDPKNIINTLADRIVALEQNAIGG